MYKNEDDEYEYLKYSSPQYLGREGITIPCIRAMAAVLTSSFRPKKVTVVSYRFPLHHDDAVMFLVWDWLVEPDVTIISDGFGTHGGEGGRGLGTVLGLLKFYGIPLEHVFIDDRGVFHELAEGRMSERAFFTVIQARPYNWDYYPVGEVQLVRQDNALFLEIDNWKFRVAGIWEKG